MTGQYQAMPDYLAALERDLRMRAAAVAPRVPDARWRRPTLAAAFAAALILPLLMMAGSVGSGTSAYGRPAVLDLPAERYVGVAVKDATFMSDAGGVGDVRHVPAFGADVELTHIGDVWCIAVPDPATRLPQIETAKTCATTRDFFRFGLAMRLGPRFFAALPSNVPPPILRDRGGATQPLSPNQLGVIAVDGLRDDQSVVLRAADGVKQPFPPTGSGRRPDPHPRPDQQSTIKNTHKRG